jgi:hypothetical protein
MKRRLLLKLGLFVLAGAIVNVTVAWGCASTPNRPSATRVPTTPEGKMEWRQRRPDGFLPHTQYQTSDVAFGCQRIVFDGTDSDGPERVAQDRPKPVTPKQEWVLRFMQQRQPSAARREQQIAWGTPATIVTDQCEELRAGWPARALCGHQWTKLDPKGIGPTITVLQSLWSHNAGPFRSPQLWPYELIWPGFALNTIFYAAILWVLFAAPGSVRRLRWGLRIRRGLCPACAYPVGTSETCTECDGAVKTG